jgi:hypothetical protein
MNFGITAYAVDIAELKALVGSFDNDFLTILKFEQRNAIIKTNKRLDEIRGPSTFGVEDYLSFILRADFINSSTHEVEYAFALEIMCKGLGNTLRPEALKDFTRNLFNELPEINELGVKREAIKDLIPFPEKFPGIGCIDNSELEQKFILARQLFQIENNYQRKRYYQEYLAWLVEANEHNAGLITFMY